ncbi:sulfotransferase [Streptomyces sp. DSM 44917]|uniref:Sulfotransferase n=1 Tax=Streptomyces boetiae TaxID=3075541 RepID=A0ABU2L6T0_9ACTN|nr:sulfotransferase [Streptomyces sp. DSM 44917]MDT0307277.1 sulfotransferase [Streptomyces sp. DSM 44917]
MRPLTFVVGTGRSGSTALSTILNAHPGILSLNELLASLQDPARALPDRPLTGEEFWRILAAPNAVFDTMTRSGIPLPEFLYTRSPGRHSAETGGIPALCLMVLPHLTDDPDAALDALAAEVTAWPVRPAPGHHLALFDLLARRFGGTAVVERSGYSLPWVPALHRAFPHARFVHLHRNGPDCALSMSRHPGYRTILPLREILQRAHVETLADLTPQHIASLPPDLTALLADRFDPSLIRDRAIPLPDFGALWSEIITDGTAHLNALPVDQWATLAYEDLLDHPHRELAALAHFAGSEPTRDWLDHAAALLSPAHRGSAARLQPAERAALEHACTPGTAALTAAHRPLTQ